MDAQDASDIYNVTSVQFSMRSPETILANSVVHVFNTELNEGASIYVPKCACLPATPCLLACLLEP